MRVALVVLLWSIATTAIGPAFAQSPDFDPYQAVIDRMTEAELEPLAQAAYGAIVERSTLGIHNGPVEPGESPVTLWSFDKDGVRAGLFFCNGQALGFGGPITAELAAVIGRNEPIVPTQEGRSVNAVFGDGYLTLGLPAQDGQLTYVGMGTKSSMIQLAFPLSVIRGGALEACQALAP